jgi:Protein of unknown function (DUF4023)
MFFLMIGYINQCPINKEVNGMDKNLQGDTQQFVENLHDRQEKDLKNRQTQGSDTPSKKLPNKQH